MPEWIHELYYFVLDRGYKISDIKIVDDKYDAWIILCDNYHALKYYPDAMTVQEWIDKCRYG